MNVCLIYMIIIFIRKIPILIQIDVLVVCVFIGLNIGVEDAIVLEVTKKCV